jgi:hypothetical protein
MVAAHYVQPFALGKIGMKPKVREQVQLRHVVSNAEVQREINNFLQALNSYPARAAKEPRVSFHQHLRRLFADDADHREARARRH